tara:strand:- start:447 stop:590 length:144 start_codon:yes stop_codon:yes gene_type:complete
MHPNPKVIEVIIFKKDRLLSLNNILQTIFPNPKEDTNIKPNKNRFQI